MLSFSDPLPLRTTADWGYYQTAQVIPLHFGDLRQAPVNCLAFDEYRRQWVPGDGELTVDSVQVDGLPVSGWTAAPVVDAQGHTQTVITLTAPAPTGVTVSAGILGLRHPTTGALLDTPDTIIGYLLTELAGRPLAGEALEVLRLAVASDGLRIAGSLLTTQTLRSAITSLANGVGLIWCDTIFTLYPADSLAGTLMASWEALDLVSLSANAEAADTASQVTVRYDYRSATDRYQAIVTRAVTTPRYSAQTITVDSPWLRDERSADRLARRLLERLAGHRLAVTWQPRLTASPRRVFPGELVTLRHPELPTWPDLTTVMVLGSVEEIDGSQTLTGEARWGDTPTTRLVAQASLRLPTTDAGIGVAIEPGLAIITVYDASGRPAPGALVAMDGGLAYTTDLAGVARIPATPGTHQVAVQLAGYQPYQLEVLVR